jgi:hypothetical protein
LGERDIENPFPSEQQQPELSGRLLARREIARALRRRGTGALVPRFRPLAQSPHDRPAGRWLIPTARWDRFTLPERRDFELEYAPLPSEPARKPAPAGPAPQRQDARRLDNATEDLLSRWFGRRVPSVTVHTGDVTDRLLRRRHAEAMTSGRDIVIRTEKYDVQRPAGLALLAHEVTHVFQQERAGPGSAPTESAEGTALANERYVRDWAPRGLALNSGLPPMEYRPQPASPPAASFMAPAAPAVAPPQFAEEGRPIDAPVPPLSPPATNLNSMELRRIQDAVYRDLLIKIRTDFERGS